MEKKYGFIVKLHLRDGAPVLRVRTTRATKRKPYPLTFSDINVPIVVKRPTSYVELPIDEHFLDFENSCYPAGASFRDDYEGRLKQQKILCLLENNLGEDILAALNGDNTLFKRKKRVVLKVDCGLELNGSNKKYRNPRQSGKIKFDGKKSIALSKV